MTERFASEVDMARFPADEPIVRALFQEYMEGLGIDLSFQRVDEELAEIPGKYAEPQGVIFLARDRAGIASGCIAMRPLPAPLYSEMKRLYVRPHARGQDLGRRLASAVIAHARAAGHRRVVLDTLASMQSAQRLYRDLGFGEVEPYYDNPVAGTLYMALDLDFGAARDEQGSRTAHR